MRNLATVFVNYQPGSHGNFLEFICNLAVNSYPNIINDFPFDTDGAAHGKSAFYRDSRIFKRGQFYNVIPGQPGIKYTGYRSLAKTIEVVMGTADMLPFWSIRFLRVRACPFNATVEDEWNPGFRPDELPDNTYYKLYNHDFNIFLKTINSHFITVDIDNPDCPRHILRDWLQRELLSPLACQEQYLQSQSHEGEYIPFHFSNFYDTNKFIENLHECFESLQLPVMNVPRILEVHNEFMSRQPFADTINECNNILDAVHANTHRDIKLDLLQESYLNLKLTELFGVEMPLLPNGYFSNTTQIQNWILKDL
jgi:hypothetical protein